MTKKTTTTTTNQKSIESFKAAAQRVQARQAAQAAKDAARHESEPVKIGLPLSMAAYNKALLDSVPTAAASFEAELAFYAESKPVQIIAGPVASVEKTESGKKAEKVKSDKADKKANIANEFLLQYKIPHGERIKSDKELFDYLAAGKSAIVVLVQLPSNLQDIEVNQAWRIKYLNDGGKIDTTSIIFTWLHDSHNTSANSSRIYGPANLKYDGFNWRLTYQTPIFRPITIFKA